MNKRIGKKGMQTTEGITSRKEDDFSEWYNQVVLKAELAEHAPTHGFMIIRPRGYSLWERIQDNFNQTLKKYNVKNSYFPLVIPESLFKKEAEHAKGFAPELAWIERKDSKEEKVALRPTSETIIYDAFSRWIRSWRDLPLKINQWCNVIRWEVKQTKLFLRTREFLWQEGHCVYATKEECDKEVKQFLLEYKNLVEGLLAIPVIPGIKTEAEKFAGALYTTSIESLMPDGRAVQMGTSHNLGQGFAKAFGIKFLDEKSREIIPWQSSWGISTRLIGALVMAHSDNKGLVLPPNIAQEKIVIIPILFEKDREKVLKKAREIEKALKSYSPILDDRVEYSPGWKFNEWELKGIPLRIEIGPKDIQNKQITLVRRDNGKKQAVKDKDIKTEVEVILKQMQKDMFNKAKKFLDANTMHVKTYQEFKKAIEQRKLVEAYFCCDQKIEEKIREETGATSRCIPFDQKENPKGICFYSNKPASKKVLFARAY
jgi:prolyl-tRNA synthetase